MVVPFSSYLPGKSSCGLPSRLQDDIQHASCYYFISQPCANIRTKHLSVSTVMHGQNILRLIQAALVAHAVSSTRALSIRLEASVAISQ
jgi:hypothetical protein